MIEYGEGNTKKQHKDHLSNVESGGWCRQLSKPHDFWYCTRPSGHTGGHETAGFGKHAHASWYTDSSAP